MPNKRTTKNQKLPKPARKLKKLKLMLRQPTIQRTLKKLTKQAKKKLNKSKAQIQTVLAF